MCVRYVNHSQTLVEKVKYSHFLNFFCSNVKCNYLMGSSDTSKGLSLTFDVINLVNGCNDSITLGIGKLFCAACSWYCIVNYCMNGVFFVQLKRDFNESNLTWLLIYKYCIEYNLLVSIYCYMIRFLLKSLFENKCGLFRKFRINVIFFQ